MTKDILLLVIGAIIGWISRWLWFRYVKSERRREGPSVAVTKVVRDGSVFAELHNVGQDNISELLVTISWLQDGHVQHRQLDRFFTTTANPVTELSSQVEYLAVGERLRAAGIPAWSDDGIVAVTVEGLGVRSEKLLNQRTELAVGLKPR